MIYSQFSDTDLASAMQVTLVQLELLTGWRIERHAVSDAIERLDLFPAEERTPELIEAVSRMRAIRDEYRRRDAAMMEPPDDIR